LNKNPGLEERLERQKTKGRETRKVKDPRVNISRHKEEHSLFGERGKGGM